MSQLIPPIAVPVRPAEVLSSVFSTSSMTETGLARSLQTATRFDRVELFHSGRCALAALLGSWSDSRRDEVIVPAYTCWTVPASIVRAGLKVRLVDQDPLSLDIDRGSLERAPMRRVLAVVGTHLFDRTCDISGLVRTVRAMDPAVRVVEDAAQAWPTSVRSEADAIILSFGRGKPLPLGGGGAMACDGGDASARPSTPGGFGEALSLVATSMLGRPAWYRFPASLPFLGLGVTVYEPNFEVDRPIWSWQERLGALLLRHLPEFQRRRTDHARTIAEAVRGIGGCQLPLTNYVSGPLRLPVLASSESKRGAAISYLLANGITSTSMYPGTLADIPALRPHLAHPAVSIDGARDIAARLLTLPVYPTLGADELQRVASSAVRALGIGES